MEAHSQPAKLPRFSDTTTGIGVIGEDHSAASIGLDLGLGPRLSHGRCGFTFLQLQELEHQALIFKYMAAGVPVPSHLVLPIWKSLSGSTAIAGMYPSFLGFRGVCFDYKNNMEAEPGRCRRTDGKKWRCSKDVVPDQKYCEKHMHRGRNRSRKHVESTSQLSNSSSSNVHSNSNSDNLSISVPLQLMTPNTTNTTTNGVDASSSSSSPSSRFGFSPPHSFLQQSGICKAESTL